MSTQVIADELNRRKWYQKGDGSAITGFQIDRRTKKKEYSNLFVREGSLVLFVGSEIHPSLPKIVSAKKSSTKEKTKTKDEIYVLNLCDEVLNRVASRHHGFDFLRGDLNSKGKARKLPVDAYYEELKLVIEYREKQHTESVPFFDKLDSTTVSGVHRREQREIYDERRRVLIPQNGIALIEISYTDFKHDTQKRIVRNYPHDVEVVRKILKDYLKDYLEK